MTAEEAVKALELLKPGIVVPMKSQSTGGPPLRLDRETTLPDAGAPATGNGRGSRALRNAGKSDMILTRNGND
jgi:hypothetical protein